MADEKEPDDGAVAARVATGAGIFLVSLGALMYGLYRRESAVLAGTGGVLAFAGVALIAWANGLSPWDL